MLSLLRLERKQKKNYSNPFRNRTFLFLSYLFGIETITTFIHSRSSLEKHTRFQTKMGKVYTRFRPKRRRNPTRWGGTYLYGWYKGVTTSGDTQREPLWRRKSWSLNGRCYSWITEGKQPYIVTTNGFFVHHSISGFIIHSSILPFLKF